MLRICIVTEAPERFSDITEALAAESDCEFDWSASVSEALSLAERCLPALMIIDEWVDGRPALEIARQIIRKNALVNLVVVSRLAPEAFHEAAEGLGIAACLPPKTDPERPQILLRTLDLLVDGLNPRIS